MGFNLAFKGLISRRVQQTFGSLFLLRSDMKFKRMETQSADPTSELGVDISIIPYGR